MLWCETMVTVSYHRKFMYTRVRERTVGNVPRRVRVGNTLSVAPKKLFRYL